MKVWLELTAGEYTKVWKKFYEDFHFKPSVHAKDWPSIRTEKPFQKYSLEKVWKDVDLIEDLNQKGIDIFIAITQPEEKIWALDWQHTCYQFDPRLHKQNPRAEAIFHIPFVPDGDYYIFLTQDFENVWFNHPWENTATLIGEKLIEAAKENLPRVFEKE